MLITDPGDGAIVDASIGACEYYGYSLEKLTSMLIFEVNTLSKADLTIEMEAVCKEQKNHFNFSHRLASGDIRSVEVYANPISIANRSLVFSIIHDTTNQKLIEKALIDSEDRFKALSDASYGGIIIHDKGLILECNKSLSDITGFTYQELVGMNGLELIANSSLQTVLSNIKSGYTKSYEVEGVRKDGSIYPVAIKGKNITFKGQTARVIEFRDITDQKNAEARLKLSASVFSNAKEGITITDINGLIIDVNDSFTEITGYSAEEVIGENPSIFQSGRHPPSFYVDMWKSIRDKGHWQGEIWDRRKNGEVYPLSLSITTVGDPLGDTLNYVGFFTDITRSKEHQVELERMAHYDVLTNLPNRILFADRIEQAMTQCQRRKTSLAVVFIDIDRFKDINDSHGHNIGDELLIALSDRMKGALREGDTLSRFGGDEFVAILADLETVQDCEPILNRMLEVAEEPVIIRDYILKVSASMGVTIYPDDDSDADKLIRHADQAMYVSKQRGKNRYHFFDTAHDDEVKIHRESMQEIKHAFEAKQFVLYYQPKINMLTGTVIGAEALIRWIHPERGLIPPLDFLPVIDNHPISIDLGEWVIETALNQINEWKSSGLIMPVSVNIGAQQLQSDGFVKFLSSVLSAYPDISPDLLELEVLETSALGDLKQVSEIMHACVDLGLSFALDDFGTGYSSLTYLRRLPTSMIKIDQTFVRDMLEDSEDLAIIEGIVGLAKSFNLNVIAEGVETYAQGVLLQKMGCNHVQGYGIARPMPAADIYPWAQNWPSNNQWCS